MRSKRGAALRLFRICIVAIAALAVYEAATTRGAPEGEKIAPSYLSPQLVQERPSATPPRPQIDLAKPLQTTSYAIVCDQEVLMRAATSRRAQDDVSKLYAAFQSVFGRSEKVRAAGCEEWKRGIPVYQADRMRAPFKDFIGFSTSPNGMREYFTMSAELENTQSGGKE